MKHTPILQFTTIEGRFVAVKAEAVVVVGEAISQPDPRLPNPLVPNVVGTMLMTAHDQFPVAGKPIEIMQMINDALSEANGEPRPIHPDVPTIDLSGFARA